MGKVEKAWQAFESQFVPKGAIPAQRQDMKKSFIAGIASAVSILCKEAIPSPSKDMTSSIVDTMKEMADELGVMK